MTSSPDDAGAGGSDGSPNATEDETGNGSDPLDWGTGIAIGLAVGVAIGVAMDNLAVGVAIGLALGPAFGLAQSNRD